MARIRRGMHGGKWEKLPKKEAKQIEQLLHSANAENATVEIKVDGRKLGHVEFNDKGEEKVMVGV